MDAPPPHASENVREVAVARDLARRAGAVASSFFGRALPVERKRGNEPVTEADRQTSRVIEQGLALAFPDDVIISEETDDDPRRLSARRVWYIDPIDGTKDFIRGLSGFSVMIGMTLAHRPLYGVVYQPIGDRMMWSDGRRAYQSLAGGAATPLDVSSVAGLGTARLVAPRSRRQRDMDTAQLGVSDSSEYGSVGLKLCQIAEAERDLYVNPTSRCKVWDTCAPEAILTAAGGRMSDIHGDPLRYDLADPSRSTGLVASNSLVHEAALARLAPLFPRTG